MSVVESGYNNHSVNTDPGISLGVGIAVMKGQLYDAYELRDQVKEHGQGDLREGLVPLANNQIEFLIDYATGPQRALRSQTTEEFDSIYNKYDTKLLTPAQLEIVQTELSRRKESDRYIDINLQNLHWDKKQLPGTPVLRFLGIHMRPDGLKPAKDNFKKGLPIALNTHHLQAYDRRALELVHQNTDLVLGQLTIHKAVDLEARLRDRLFDEHSRQRFDQWIENAQHEIGRKMRADERLPAWAREYYGQGWN